MEIVLGFALGLVLAGAVLGFFYLQRRPDQALARVDEVAGRLSQMAETQAAGQAQLAQRLQEQERALSRAVEERLSQVTTRVSETLEIVAQSVGYEANHIAVGTSADPRFVPIKAVTYRAHDLQIGSLAA